MSSDARLSNLVGALVIALSDRMRDATEAALGHGAAAPAALIALDEFLGGGSVDQLRQVVGLTPSGAVRLVDRLAQDGYVERRAGADARTVALVLTAKGRAAARRIRRARSASLDAVLAELSIADRSKLTALCEQMLSTLTRERLSARAAGRPPAGGWLCRLCDQQACGRDRGACPTANTARATFAG